MMIERGRVLVVSMIAGAFVAGACSETESPGGGGSSGNVDGGGANDNDADDAMVDVDGDGSGPDDATNVVYPAFTPFIGQIGNSGGAVLSHPVIVAITWADDDPGAVSTIEAFADGIGPSKYWSTALGQYGVGAATCGPTNHVHVPSASPAQMSDGDIQAFLSQNAGALLPAATDETMYSVFLSAHTSLVFNGHDACSAGVGGYHFETVISGTRTQYAVVPRCAGHSVTAGMSHELAETATDPHAASGPAWNGFEDPYMAWDIFQGFWVGAEVGDACEFFQDSWYSENLPPLADVQRLWSNKSAAAGHAPCVPAAPGAYFNVTALNLEDIVIDLSEIGAPSAFHTKGYKASVGQTISFHVGFYSDGPTSGPWKVTASSGNPVHAPTTYLTASVQPSKTSGINGDTTTVTATLNGVGTPKAAVLTLASTLNGVTHLMPVLIGGE
jgi:hypothetical protein